MSKDLSEIVKQIDSDIHSLSSVEIKQKYLSKNGIVTTLFKGIKDISQEERVEYGKKLNDIKNLLEENIKRRKEEDISEGTQHEIDPTAPFDVNSKVERRPKILDLKGSNILSPEGVIHVSSRMSFRKVKTLKHMKIII